jgi:mRNA interferase MazF
MLIEDGALQRFIAWTKLKIRLHCTERVLFYHEREIWWASLGHNVGSEQNGKNERFERPVLVLRKFSAQTFWGLPLTTKGKEGPFHFPLPLADGGANYANLSQIKLMSSKRLIRHIGKVSSQDFTAIQDKIIGLIKNETPLRGNLGAPLLEP